MGLSLPTLDSDTKSLYCRPISAIHPHWPDERPDEVWQPGPCMHAATFQEHPSCDILILSPWIWTQVGQPNLNRKVGDLKDMNFIPKEEALITLSVFSKLIFCIIPRVRGLPALV
ncbi:hypothetical protein Anapl_03749 [Anas platyrhynchos]|uniref:Uncharacterized protein n=1 Tax=Anas platyrhynchos TaxID=8839 RepID=R0K909_ANAPL|nr:hypothetical protein Anapl_03749 [Anas platyrhynchos]